MVRLLGNAPSLTSLIRTPPILQAQAGYLVPPLEVESSSEVYKTPASPAMLQGQNLVLHGSLKEPSLLYESSESSSILMKHLVATTGYAPV